MRASAASRMSLSVTAQLTGFQEFQPSGGVAARPSVRTIKKAVSELPFVQRDELRVAVAGVLCSWANQAVVLPLL